MKKTQLGRGLLTAAVIGGFSMMLAACGGSDSKDSGGSTGTGGVITGPGDGNSTTAPTLRITAQNAPNVTVSSEEVLSIARALAYDGWDGVLDIASADESAQTSASRPSHRRRSATLLGASLAEGREAKAGLSIAASSTSIPCDSGRVVQTESEIRFEDCTYEEGGEEWGYTDTLNGTVQITPISIDGYDQAFRYAFDLTLSFEEWDEWDNETFQGEGQITGGFEHGISDMRLLVKELNLRLQDSGSYNGAAYTADWGFAGASFANTWDGAFGKIVFNGTFTDTGTGAYGAHALGGSIHIATNEYLRPSWPFYMGQALRISGASGSRLELIYSDDGNQLDIHLDGTKIKEFTDVYDFLMWQWGEEW